jgi:hypothetical protein
MTTGRINQVTTVGAGPRFRWGVSLPRAVATHRRPAGNRGSPGAVSYSRVVGAGRGSRSSSRYRPGKPRGRQARAKASTAAVPPCCRFRFSSRRGPLRKGCCRGTQAPTQTAHARVRWSARSDGHVGPERENGYRRALCTGSFCGSFDHRSSIRKRSAAPAAVS